MGWHVVGGDGVGLGLDDILPWKSVEFVCTGGARGCDRIFLTALARSLFYFLVFFCSCFLLLPCFVFIFAVKCVLSGRPQRRRDGEGDGGHEERDRASHGSRSLCPPGRRGGGLRGVSLRLPRAPWLRPIGPRAQRELGTGARAYVLCASCGCGVRTRICCLVFGVGGVFCTSCAAWRSLH